MRRIPETLTADGVPSPRSETLLAHAMKVNKAHIISGGHCAVRKQKEFLISRYHGYSLRDTRG